LKSIRLMNHFLLGILSFYKLNHYNNNNHKFIAMFIFEILQEIRQEIIEQNMKEAQNFRQLNLSFQSIKRRHVTF